MTDETEAELNPQVVYAIKANEHLWSITTIRTIGDDFLDHFDKVAVDPNADPEASWPDASGILGQTVDCVICEQQYSPLARRRRCPGPKVHPGMRLV